MSEISICGYGIVISYWKHIVHPYFTKNETRERKITELMIRVGKLVTPRISWRKQWTPTYKITVTWDNDNSDIEHLQITLDKLNVKWYTYYSQQKIEILFKGLDDERHNIISKIQSLRCYNKSYDANTDMVSNFKTETVIEKW